jgi:Superinfection immunity protein
MFFVIFCGVLYFLPSIIGHDKQQFAGIFVLNFLLGWTVIGWILALVWACTADVRAPMLAVAGPGHYCSRCGALSPQVAHFCWACGSRI